MAIFATQAYAAGLGVTTLLALRFSLAAAVFWAIVGVARRAPRPGAAARRLSGALALGAVGYTAQAGLLLLRAAAHRRRADVAAALHVPGARLRRAPSRSAASALGRRQRRRARPRQRGHRARPARRRRSAARGDRRRARPRRGASTYARLHPRRRPHRRRVDPSRCPARSSPARAFSMTRRRRRQRLAGARLRGRGWLWIARARAGLDRRCRSARSCSASSASAPADRVDRLDRRAGADRRPGRGAARRAARPGPAAGGALVLAAVVALQLARRRRSVGGDEPAAHAPAVLPQLARPRTTLPEGDGWAYEPKWDGFRAIVFVDGDDVDLQSRNGKPLTRYFPEVTFPAGRYVLDGEIVAAIVRHARPAHPPGRSRGSSGSRRRRRRGSSPSTCSRSDDDVLLERPYERAPRRARRRVAGIELTPVVLHRGATPSSGCTTRRA